MNSKILCNWLGFEAWPPDPHALLGVDRDEQSIGTIERQVHERMAKLRCYQLSHPEEATEGMNRLAQAFICLTDSLSKAQRADKQTNGQITPKSAPAAETQPLIRAANQTELDWKNTPPPVRLPLEKEEQARSGPEAKSTAPAVTPAPPMTQSGAHILIGEIAEAQRGLGTLPAVIERVNQTRKFIITWNQAGKYLSNSKRKLTRASEDAELTRRLNRIFELTADFPKILGHPGQPGYRVVAMARLEMTAQMFRMLDDRQRDCLAKDWHAGYQVLLWHRRFLREQFKQLRSRSPASKLMKAIRGALNDHPAWSALAAALIVGLCVLVYRKIF